MGRKDLQLMNAGQMDGEGRGLTQVGMYLECIITVLYLLMIVFVIAIWVLGLGLEAFQAVSMNNL